jgi:hypothetical protein
MDTHKRVIHHDKTGLVVAERSYRGLISASLRTRMGTGSTATIGRQLRTSPGTNFHRRALCRD